MKKDTKEDLLFTIGEMKIIMVNVAEIYNFDFQHPQVLRISQEIDSLIFKLMKLEEKHAKNITFCWSSLVF